ncbi:hypothetical protein VTP01DRAFT_1524 [Rhizomucor pusillus]|uniref:uncharacterized protein n=1 Tax=Rhizomucor pusillus TaxID=4840 RepID=UPI00374223D7
MFLSPCSRSSDPIASRDSNIEKSTLSPFTCSGAAQGKQRTSTKALIITDILQIDMLQHLRKSKNKHFVLICLTYAGLTTDPDDLRKFLRCHKSDRYIVIDNYAKDNKFEVLSRDDILVNAYVADKFACRPSIAVQYMAAELGNQQSTNVLEIASG